jgi:beta-phosphoglucomutase-like phosphatase (HAD superfamily)
MKSLGIIIFDMDGTLVDSMQVYTDAFCLVLNRAHGVSRDISGHINGQNILH